MGSEAPAIARQICEAFEAQKTNVRQLEAIECRERQEPQGRGYRFEFVDRQTGQRQGVDLAGLPPPYGFASIIPRFELACNALLTHHRGGPTINMMQANDEDGRPTMVVFANLGQPNGKVVWVRRPPSHVTRCTRRCLHPPRPSHRTRCRAASPRPEAAAAAAATRGPPSPTPPP
ncbi:unnamed protein product [Vitrella brassicaformis CCMP3155]|uniref:Uncharacterized protein n=1 Tax=Vitrella brassicaformis (strain CCMP3155) TaxID=1169540 RepID=A0A0G4FUD1_VITBC|nr:unnamed protein product [Vitrella brassicaformis CCMP3155]|eukprot:CEM18337.1 unnamed protein product [Vitrella brassicaformis CCMP3155]